MNDYPHQKMPFKVYLVGGAVRDRLLGLPVKERDWVVVGATPQQMLNLGFKPVGKDFPVFLHPESGEEYALARTERKTGRGYYGFECIADPTVTLEEDLLRRDLTINAMAQSVEGTLIDPYGGAEDLKHRWLRHVSPAFVEDPVRLLRVARFLARYHSLGFKVAEPTFILLNEMVRSGEINALVPERVWLEFEKTLSESHPEEFIYLLRRVGALKILFPELDQLFGVPNPAKWHAEVDTGIHILLVLRSSVQLTKDPCVRFAALVHDLGKGVTPKEKWPSHPGHEEEGRALINTLCDRYRVSKSYRELALITAQYHGLVFRWKELRPATWLNILERCDAFRRPQRFADMLLACVADARGRPGHEYSEYPLEVRERLLSLQQAVRIIKLSTEEMQKAADNKAIAETLRRKRLVAIRQFLQVEKSKITE